MNIRLLLLTFLLPVFASAQFLPSDTPLQQAFIEATQKDKLIFLLLESAECQQCNDVADKALQNDSLKKDLQKNFIALRISPLHADLNYIKEKYNYYGGNGVLFLDKWGTLVHRMNMSTTLYNKYVLECMHAIMKKTEADHVRTLEKEALTGSLDINRLYALMELRKTLSLSNDALLNQYVRQLPADSLNMITTLQRIVRMNPVIGTDADVALRKNQELFNRAWRGLPQQERAVINGQIIFKSRQLAIADKNLSRADEVATFAKRIHTRKETGENAYHYNMMEYYRGIHDTAAYLLAAVDYYEQYKMTTDAAAIKEKDSLQRIAVLDQAQNATNRSDDQMTSRTTIRFSPMAPHYGQILNYGARSFYLMTNDNYYLKKALQWAAYANEFHESAYALDTWARLVYKVDKNVAQAVALEERAIELLKTQGFSTDAHTAVLNKMKKGE
ncbi:MAG TPA: thioredoxin family protein [Niastella sp.]